jgi:serine/threonine protein kinase
MNIKLTIGDFGECKIFSSEKDELCQRNRGTDFCKSPEMLQLTINTRKDTDKYDRRKQVGTNRLSDVWSAGCLLYELLTGEFLFYTPDYLQFHFRVTRPSEALFTQDKLDKINNNVYLIDFMKYMLVRDPRLRPSIENVLRRFEHVHALLVSTTGGSSLTNFRIQSLSG